MQYDEFLATMNHEDFLKAYEAKKEELKMWQQEYDDRMTSIKYEETKICTLLRMFDDIFRAEYMGKTDKSEEFVKDCFASLFSYRIEVSAILKKLSHFAYETDRICIDDGFLETALEEALPFR